MRHSCKPMFVIRSKKRKTDDTLFYIHKRNSDSGKKYREFYVLHNDPKNPPSYQKVHARKLKTSEMHKKFNNKYVSLEKYGAYYLEEDPNQHIEEAFYEEFSLEEIHGKAIVNDYLHKKGLGRRMIVTIPKDFMLEN